MCADCDAKLGDIERIFAERFYRPFVKGRVPINYGPWLSQFCATTSWRVLLEIRLHGGPPNYSERAIRQAEQALSVWKGFLLNEVKDVGAFQFHILPLNQGPSYDEWMIAGAVGNHAYYHEPDESAFVISKLGPLVIIGTVNDPTSSVWNGTHVRRDGHFGDNDTFHIPESLRSYFERWQEVIGKRLDVAAVKNAASSARTARGALGPPSILAAPDYAIDIRYLGPKSHPLKLAVTMRPVDESWDPFFVAMPTDVWLATRPSLRIGPAEKAPWILPPTDTQESTEGGWTILRAVNRVMDPDAAFLLADKIPNLLLFGGISGPHKRILLGAAPKDSPELPKWLRAPSAARS
jgi:hypothetical protein